ncbi:hypothetical protein Bca52824_042236 [Brassica carinata]|uniref:Uncharacterized protein n=1 Tax=Brassica carinata TaxID=52824 RepID=A0A8X7RWZ9_BRACI|nr:hypothetical protein Bca52824_042236 [Brassica carinata]
MEKREPSLVPEWLRSSGNGSGVGNKSHIQSSSARSDNNKSRNPRAETDVDSVRSPLIDRSSSTDARRRFREVKIGEWRDRPSYIDPWDRDSRFPFGTFLNGRNQEQSRRSNSMTTRKHDDYLAQGFTNATSSRDFPRLKTEEGMKETQTLLAVQSLSVGDSGITAGEGWASARRVPNDIKKSGSDSDITSNTLTGQTRNMAEAFLQPPRTGIFNDKRLEDQALKLIPVVPSAPKGSVSMTKPMLVILNPAGKESGGPSRITNSVAAGFQMIAAPSAPFITSVAQTQSRNAFYSALKKKTSTNISTSSCIFPSVEEKSDISKELVASNPSSVHAAERDGGFEPADLPDEEEAEFLKSLGWDENNTEVEALTDEEIRAFYEQHKKLKPSLMKKLPIIKEATEDATLSS